MAETIFQPKRFKVYWGGRDSGRSWGCAQALLALGLQRPLRILCARELQKSIDDSVHRLLDDQIGRLGMRENYTTQVNHIKGSNGTEFSFEGIKANTNKIRSYEGIDYCWVEEAQKTSEVSWNILIPTIRKKGSEIWLTFNPELESDYTYKRFVLEADPETTFVVHMTWRDNPWFMETEGYQEMLHAAKFDPDMYLNVWEGQCVKVLKGAVYANELRQIEAQNRVCRVPYEHSVPVDTFWDLGRADNTAIWFGQQVAMQFRVLAYYEANLQDVTHFIKELQSREYIYGKCYLPHDAKAKRLGTKKSIEEMIQQFNFKTSIVPKLSLTDGINASRLLLRRCYFDSDECRVGLKALREYKYKVVNGQFSNEPLHDWASDGADAFRYMAIAQASRSSKSLIQRVMEGMRGESGIEIVAERLRTSSGLPSRHDWMNG